MLWWLSEARMSQRRSFCDCVSCILFWEDLPWNCHHWNSHYCANTAWNVMFVFSISYSEFRIVTVQNWVQHQSSSCRKAHFLNFRVVSVTPFGFVLEVKINELGMIPQNRRQNYGWEKKGGVRFNTVKIELIPLAKTQYKKGWETNACILGSDMKSWSIVANCILPYGAYHWPPLAPHLTDLHSLLFEQSF